MRTKTGVQRLIGAPRDCFVVKASRQELTSFARRIEWRGYHSAAFFADCVLIAPAKANSRSPPHPYFGLAQLEPDGVLGVTLWGGPS